MGPRHPLLHPRHRARPQLGRSVLREGYARGQAGQSGDKVVADLSRAIELEPDYARAYRNRGAAHAKKRKWDHALQDFTRAIDLHDFFPPDVAPDRKIWIPCRVKVPDDIPEILEKRRSDGTTERIEARKRCRKTYEEGWYAYMEAFVKTGSMHPAFDGNEDTTGPRPWSCRIEPARGKGFIDCREAIRAYYRKQGTWPKPFKPAHAIALLNAGASVERDGTGAIRKINLGGTEATDSLMREVTKCRQVREVILPRTFAVEDGLRHLRALRRLEALQVARSPFDGRGLAHLAGLPRLRSLCMLRSTYRTFWLSTMAPPRQARWWPTPTHASFRLGCTGYHTALFGRFDLPDKDSGGSRRHPDDRSDVCEWQLEDYLCMS